MPQSAPARDWAAGLPAPILADIRHLLPSIPDQFHFTAVCSHWRTFAKRSRLRHWCPTRSTLVLLTPTVAVEEQTPLKTPPLQTSTGCFPKTTMPPPAPARDWAAGLTADILADILPFLPSFDDHLHFAAVCSSWRSVAKHFRRRHRSPKPSPWVLLEPRKSPTDARGPLQFVRPSDGRLLPITLPYPGHPECVGISPDGWLILDDGGPRRLHAINPFTGGMLLLPSPAAVSGGTRTVVRRVAMSMCPYAEDASIDVVDAGWPRSAVFAAVLTGGYDEISVALARAGDRRWEALRMGHLKEVFDVTYHQGKFYILGSMSVVDGHRRLAFVGVVDLSAEDPLSTAKVTVLPLHFESSPRLSHDFRLIGSPSGDLLLAETSYVCRRIDVFLVDLHATGNLLGGSEGLKLVKLTDLGRDRALLVGDLCSMVVSTRGASQLRGTRSHSIHIVGRGSSVTLFSVDTEGWAAGRGSSVTEFSFYTEGGAAWFAPGLL